MNDDGGTHKYLRVQMKRKLLRLGVSQTDAAEFDTTLKELKQVRTDADYLNLRINETESREARRMSEQVNTLIKDTFSIT